MPEGTAAPSWHGSRAVQICDVDVCCICVAEIVVALEKFDGDEMCCSHEIQNHYDRLLVFRLIFTMFWRALSNNSKTTMESTCRRYRYSYGFCRLCFV